MQQTERKPLFDLGQLVATPGALAALEKKRTESDGLPLAPRYRRLGRDLRRRPQRKPKWVTKASSWERLTARELGDRRYNCSPGALPISGSSVQSNLSIRKFYECMIPVMTSPKRAACLRHEVLWYRP